MSERAAKIHTPCPLCGKSGLRFHMKENLLGTTVDIICIKCEEVDVSADLRTLCEAISGITKRVQEKGSVDADWINGFLDQHFEM